MLNAQVLAKRMIIVQFNAKVRKRLKMNKLLKWMTKYWLIISVCVTIISSLATWSLHLKSRIDKDEDILNDTKQWVSDHDDDLKALHDDVLKLKEDQRLRESGQCK